MRVRRALGVALIFSAASGVLACACAWADPSLATGTSVVIKQTESNDIKNEDYYFRRVLELALTKSSPRYGACAIEELPSSLSEKRLQSELLAKRLDVLWAPYSEELGTAFLPIKISLLKELNNYRLLLIRPEMQSEFSKVKNLNDLRKFNGGMNPQWADADIMEANDLPLVKAVGYGKLFKMLAAKRFDYFSRGLYQVKTEVNYYPELHLAIEQNLMLHYSNPVYFFVRKDNKALAERLTLGLEIAEKDGSFDQLFNSIPRYQWGMEELKHNQRRLFNLQPVDKKDAH